MVNEKDPFDEFEFKPLTSGLGFHKKSESLNFENQTTDPIAKNSIQFTNPKMNFSNDVTPQRSTRFNTHNEVTSKNTLQKQISVPNIEDDSIFKAQSAVNEILKNLNQQKQQENSKKIKPITDWKATTPSLAAAGLDTLFVVALFLVCLVSTLVITRVDLVSSLSNVNSDPSIWIATGSLFLMVFFVYMTLLRTYMGCTLGEWAFDQRCGKDTDLADKTYVLRLVARHLVLGLTGFIPLILISKILNYDLAGTLINLPVQRRSS